MLMPYHFVCPECPVLEWLSMVVLACNDLLCQKKKKTKKEHGIGNTLTAHIMDNLRHGHTNLHHASGMILSSLNKFGIVTIFISPLPPGASVLESPCQSHLSMCLILSGQYLLNCSTVSPNLVWWCIKMRWSVTHKSQFTIFKVKVTVRAYITKRWLFLL